MICSQNTLINELDKSAVTIRKAAIKCSREQHFVDAYKSIYEQATVQRKKVLEMACEKGSYSWFSALPLQSHGYTLNKVEFRDAVCLRYNWPIQNIPRLCGGCGSKNDTDHALSCKTGGYVSFRHDALRDTEADLLKEVCRDVRVEPILQPTRGDLLSSRANTADQARLDIAATGLWSRFERTFFDVRVTHPNAPSNRPKTLKQLYASNETEKKMKYAQRVINTEKGSFCPLVYTTSGGTGPECTTHHKRVAQLISLRRNERYEDVINFIRVKVRFALLKSVLMAIRGIRGKQKIGKGLPISSISFGLIPEHPHYEA